jgi:4-amino-4-deoxy-L-arabinose transferase-like glycosyltransferase
LGSIPLLSLNEARRALPVQAMLTGGNWLLPRLNGELYITKPPLFYWLGAMVAELRGAADEWAVRLPSALAVLWTGYRVALRWFGRWSALFTVQILLANAGFAVFEPRKRLQTLVRPTLLFHADFRKIPNVSDTHVCRRPLVTPR